MQLYILYRRKKNYWPSWFQFLADSLKFLGDFSEAAPPDLCLLIIQEPLLSQNSVPCTFTSWVRYCTQLSMHNTLQNTNL